MIVPMKKVFLVVLEAEKRQAVAQPAAAAAGAIPQPVPHGPGRGAGGPHRGRRVRPVLHPCAAGLLSGTGVPHRRHHHGAVLRRLGPPAVRRGRAGAAGRRGRFQPSAHRHHRFGAEPHRLRAGLFAAAAAGGGVLRHGHRQLAAAGPWLRGRGAGRGPCGVHPLAAARAGAPGPAGAGAADPDAAGQRAAASVFEGDPAGHGGGHRPHHRAGGIRCCVARQGRNLRQLR